MPHFSQIQRNNSEAAIFNHRALLAGNDAKKTGWLFPMWHSLARRLIKPKSYHAGPRLVPAGRQLTVSVRNVRTLTAVTLVPLFVPILLCRFNQCFDHPSSISLSSPLYPPLFEGLWQGRAASSLHLSGKIPSMNTQMSFGGTREMHFDGQISLSGHFLSSLLFPDTLPVVCYAPSLDLAPAQCLLMQ